MGDSPRQSDVGRAIIAPVAGALQGTQLRELGFPVAQDVLGDAEFFGEFADGAESLRILVGGRHLHAYFATLSRMIWLARKVMTRRGAIGTSTPVLGLRPMRWPLSRRMKLPKPEIFTFCPSDSEWHMWCRTRSTTFADSARD